MTDHARKIIHEELSAMLKERGQTAPDALEGSFLSVIDSLAFVVLMLRVERRTGVVLDVSGVDLAELVKVDSLVCLLASTLKNQSRPGTGTDG
jgi:acyl carrier protein